MKRVLVSACLAGLALAGARAHAESAVAEAPPPVPPIALEDRIAGAEVFSLEAARMDGAFGAALNDLARHLTLEAPPAPIAAEPVTAGRLRAAENPRNLVQHRITDLTRAATDAARRLYRIEEALDGLEGIASKGLGLVRIRHDSSAAAVEPGIAATDPALAQTLEAANALALTIAPAMDLRAETATLLERVQALPRDPKGEPILPVEIAAQLAERARRLAALMDAGAIGDRAPRPANWQEAARDSLERLIGELQRAAEDPTPQPAYVTVDVQLLLAFLRLQTVQAALYAKDLARFTDHAHSFPLADHKVLVAALESALRSLRRRTAWADAYQGLKGAYEEEAAQVNAQGAEYGFKLIADYTDLLPHQRSLCVESRDAGATEGTVFRINAILSFTYGMQGEFAVTRLTRGPVVAEPAATRIFADGFVPACIEARTMTEDPDSIAARLETEADRVIAAMRLSLSRIEMLARHANLMKDLAERADKAATALTAMEEALAHEPKAIARYGNDVACSARKGAKLRGEGEVSVLLEVNGRGRVSDAEILDAKGLSSRAARTLPRSLRSAFDCKPYEPYRIDGKAVHARKRVTLVLSK